MEVAGASTTCLVSHLWENAFGTFLAVHVVRLKEKKKGYSMPKLNCESRYSHTNTKLYGKYVLTGSQI